LRAFLQLLLQRTFSCGREQGEGARRRTRKAVESQTVAQQSRGGRRRPRERTPWGDGPGADALVLGRYRLHERLGAGGFGVVWSAHDELLRRAVAVKRIALAPGEDGERASREALASARLAHPAIVALYEACPAGDAFYLISELVDGETLAQLIADDALDDDEALAIGVALCGALEHAHARGVIHRDVKPQNVLVPYGGEGEDAAPRRDAPAKLTDFGGARLLGHDALTRTGDVLGTLAYMAPEQSEGRGASTASDLYSLALVLYEALGGVNPVRGATPAETVRRIGRPLPSLARARRDLPRELARAIDRALLRAPGARGTLVQLRAALAAELGESPTRIDGELPRRSLVGRDRRAREPKPVFDAPPDWTDVRVHGGAESATWIDERAYARSPPRRGVRAEHAQARPLAGDRVAAVELDARAHGGERDAAHARTTQRRGMPRALWLALTLTLAIWQAASGRAGVSLLVLCALLPVVALPVGRHDLPGTGGWAMCALAPALGVIGLAGAFPALAGQATRWRMRAALGALGYWWLALAEPLSERHLWLGPLASTPSRAVWEGSLSTTALHVVAPLLSVATLLGAALWALGAALLGLLVRGRGAALDVLAAAAWASALAATTPLLDGGLAAQATHVAPRGLIVGSLLAGALAVGARALRGPV
jgi:eukaryotic-like serine/threonine-protein kinase